jgi:sugar phosphate isomerase/epimerase
MSCLCFDKNGNKIENAIFGYSGFVGIHLIKKYKFGKLYNSSNIKDSINGEYNEIFICCVPAVKWLANKHPEKDASDIEEIKNIFKTISARKVILISTIDVYNNINNKSNEKTTILCEENNTYGKNRFLFEEFIKTTFNNYHIIRLPALFGRGLKKNIIYDLINDNGVSNIPINSAFQWYNLEWLKDDIEICKKNNIQECNLFTEPLETTDILSLFNHYDYSKNNTSQIIYDVQTIHSKFFPHGSIGYIRNKQDVLNNIKSFINNSKPLFSLCVSNISNSSLPHEQYYSILKHYGIKHIEIAPTKFYKWDELFCNIIKFKKIKEIKEQLDLFDLRLSSFQSITYTICNNIFDDNNDIVLLHLKNVIDLACSVGVNNLVFGCPKNRKIIDNAMLNDDTFVVFFKKLGDYIGERDVIISIENNSKKYDCNYLNTINDVGKIVNKINHPKIKMMVDVGNCVMEDDNIEDLLNYKDIINHIHISSPFMNPLINYNSNLYSDFIKLLKKINYDKIISLEFLNDNENEVKILNDSICNFLELLSI